MRSAKSSVRSRHMHSTNLCADQIEAGDVGNDVLRSGCKAEVELDAHDVEVFFLNFYTSKVRRPERLSKDTKQGSVSRLFWAVFYGFFN